MFDNKETKLKVFQLIERKMEIDGEEKTKIIKKVIMTCTFVDANFVIEK